MSILNNYKDFLAEETDDDEPAKGNDLGAAKKLLMKLPEQDLKAILKNTGHMVHVGWSPGDTADYITGVLEGGIR